MARQLSIEFPNAYYHVYSRGLNRQWLFCDDEDFLVFTKLLWQAKDKFELRIFAYCLMNNHYHLYLCTKLPNLSIAIKYLNQNYAKYFLKKYPEKDGHVFRGRFKRKIVQSDLYSLELVRYIHQNPLKAGMVKNLSDWQWSSYNRYLDMSSYEVLIEKDFILEQMGNEACQINNFLEFHDQSNDDFNVNLNSGNFLANNEFIKEFIQEHNLQLENFSNEISGLSILQNIICDESVISREIDKLNLPDKLRQKLRIYMLHEFSRVSLNELAKRYNKSIKTISKVKERFKREMLQDDFIWLQELIKKCRMSRYDP